MTQKFWNYPFTYRIVIFPRVSVSHQNPVPMRKSLFLSASLALVLLGQATALAQTEPKVNVRAGVHGTFDRIVFDWPKNIKYEIRQNGNKTSVEFMSSGALAFSRDVKTRLTRAKDFTVHTNEGGNVTVSFTINPNAKVRSFTNAASIVVDVESAPLKQAASPKKPEAKKPVQQQPEAKIATPQQTEKPVETQAALTTPAQQTPKNEIQPLVSDALKPEHAAPPQEPPAETKPAPPQEAEVVLEKPKPAVSGLAVEEKAPEFGFSLTENPLLVATLDPRIKARTAIFLRANVGYIIFDNKMALTKDTLLGNQPALIDLQPLNMPNNTGFRFSVPPESSMQATLDGTSWKIYLSEKRGALSVSSTLIAQPDFLLGARFLLPLPDGPDPIRFEDPIVGDSLIIIPLGQSEAFSAERRMVDFTILPSAQGLVLKPTTDKLAVRTVSDGVEISAEGGLMLSRASDTSGTEQPQSQPRRRGDQSPGTLFDFKTWRGKPTETFTQTRQRLQQTIVDVAETERNRARLELARFYFSRGFGFEAASMLEMLLKQVPDLKFHGDFMALLGASQILANRPVEGLGSLSASGLTDQPEIILWQAVALANLREWKMAEEKFSARRTVLSAYPEPFFSRFFILAIESALATDQTNEAADWITFVTNAPHSEHIDPALSFLRGVLAAKAGNAREAETAWKMARNSNDRLYKIRAELALIDLAVTTGSLTPAQAANRLEALRFGWRGDDLEIDILRRLGQFYIRSHNVKAGINTLSRSVMLYPDSSFAAEIRQEMSRVFQDTLLNSADKKLSPLDALTLYQQYRDMLPEGKKGSALMLNLSERLIAVDLLDQASSILEDLAKNRLDGEEKSRAALRLAAIRLLDQKPAEALNALNIIASATMQDKHKNESILLRARALSKLRRSEEALSLLKDNPSQGASLLRANIAMENRRWEEAGKIMMDLLGTPPAAGEPLSPEKADWLMTAALAFALSSDQQSLDRLAIDFAAAMAGSPKNAAFLMLTQPEKPGRLRDLSSAQLKLSQVDMFQSFLNDYRKSSFSPQSPAQEGTP